MKLCKSLACSLSIVNVVIKPPPSLRSTAPIEISDIDNKIASPVSLSKSVNDRLISMSEGYSLNLVTVRSISVRDN